MMQLDVENSKRRSDRKGGLARRFAVLVLTLGKIGIYLWISSSLLQIQYIYTYIYIADLTRACAVILMVNSFFFP